MISISSAWLLGLNSVLQVATGSEAEQAPELRGTRVVVQAEQSPPSRTYTTGFRGDPKPPPELVEWFAPPEKYRTDFGGFRSPLLFADGTPVRTPADWQRRRAEILATWHKLMGPWPPLIERPRVEVVHTSRRENIIQQELRIEIALGGEMVEGLLLVPEGEGAAGGHPARKRPAVLVVYYDAETGVGLGAPLRDYAWQLARRGFVALSIGNSPVAIRSTE